MSCRAESVSIHLHTDGELRLQRSVTQSHEQITYTRGFSIAPARSPSRQRCALGNLGPALGSNVPFQGQNSAFPLEPCSGYASLHAFLSFYTARIQVSELLTGFLCKDYSTAVTAILDFDARTSVCA